MTAEPLNRQELLFLGKECHHPSCHLNDFLPFNCPACQQSFCQPHFLPSAHSCTAPLPPSMVDRIAPQCPMCNEVVLTTASREPNEAVERHILSGTCVGMPGGEDRKKAELKAKKERGEVCWRRGCHKTLVVPMKCDQCEHVFCPSHRHSTSHSCNASPSSSRGATPQPPAAASRSGAKAAMSRLLASSKPSSSTISTPSVPERAAPPSSPAVPIRSASSDVRTAAGAAALQRLEAAKKVPFVKTKTEKRADAENASALKAMKERHDKGLLSKTEEIKYAELLGKTESKRRRGERSGDKCTIA